MLYDVLVYFSFSPIILVIFTWQRPFSVCSKWWLGDVFAKSLTR